VTEQLGRESLSGSGKVSHPSIAERAKRGRHARAAAPRSAHARLSAPDRDPVALLESQAVSRVPELVPIRYGRMLTSPFAFFRGAAALMAHDLAQTPSSGLEVQLCGDAHLSNFGGFATPERDLVLDVNDFDETLPGPFEWDLKRLAASFEIAGRNRGFTATECREAVLTVVRGYREAMRAFAEMGNMDVWYSRLSVPALAAQLREQRDTKQADAVDASVAKARTKDSMRAFAKLTEVVDGERRIRSDPPLVVRLAEVVEGFSDPESLVDVVRDVIREYRQTLQGDRRHLLEEFRLVDVAHKVVGVGSVGTRCWIVLMVGRDDDDPLFLQMKEAQPSVLEPYLGKSRFENHGRRVVEGQRLMQASSDIFLGWHRVVGLDGHSRDFYCRQLWDWKASLDLDRVAPRGLLLYAQALGWTLARAHSRSGDRIAIAEYLGKTDKLDRALASFASDYAEVNDRDYSALAAAVDRGRVDAEQGI
jgi:uncharacterized protein (DUF2252 family)